MADHDVDLEAQQQIPLQAPKEVGGSEIRVTSIPPSETKSGTSGAELGSTDHQIHVEAPPPISQAAGGSESKAHDTDVQQLQRDIGASLSSPVETGLGKTQADQSPAEHLEAQTTPIKDDQSVRPRSHKSSAEQETQEIRMIGDFDGSANALWTLYRSEAKSHDKSRIQTLKDDMDGVLIFAGLFSAVLTSFIIDSKQNLKANPTDQMVYYLQQNVAMLSQISHQISSIAPQIVIPSSPPPLYPDFSPSSSNIRVNVFWFMALIFSLSSALLAILVQQWVREYMHVFQKYSDPLKAARLRQYLHDGCENWYMPVLAEAVPGLLHISLFLFFVGLADAVLQINTTVGVSTVVPIGLCGLFYIFTTFAPIFYPQSPYQNSFSGLIWYLFQRLHGRTFKDRSLDGGSKSVSPNKSEGQMQLAMEETGGRMMRDEEAVQWLIKNMTEEAEMELFVAAIPGSFNAEWGIEVWRRVFEVIRDENDSELAGMNTPNSMALADQPSLRVAIGRNRPVLHLSNATYPSVPGSSQGDHVVRELCRRVAHSLETCKNRGLFASDEQWRKRTRACIETTASLVGCANARLGWFGDIGRLLGDIGKIEKTGEQMSTGMDHSFVLRWTCLSLMSIRSVLSRDSSVRVLVRGLISKTRLLGRHEDPSDDDAWENVQKVDDDLEGAMKSLSTIFWSLHWGGDLTKEGVKEILRNHESQISDLERINAEADRLVIFDILIEDLPTQMDESIGGIICQLPGFQNRFAPIDPIPFTQIIDFFINPRKWFTFPPGRILKRLCSFAPAFRDMLEGQDIEKTRETLGSLDAMKDILHEYRRSRLFQRQLWRLKDIYDGRGLGTTIELFFMTLEQLLSTPLSPQSQSALYVGTFRAITSHWNLCKHSIGTQKLLLDAAASSFGIFSSFQFPAFITDEFLVLLGNVLDKQTDSNIDDAVQQLREEPRCYWGSLEFRQRALGVILQSRIVAPVSS